MVSLNPKALGLFLVGTVALAAAAGHIAYYYYYVPPAPPQDDFRLESSKTGGIAGVNDTLTVRADGSATVVSRYGASFNATVPPVEFSELRQTIAANLNSVSPRTLQAKAGAADYFGYRLSVATGAGTTELLWVDQWAANGTFPQGLSAIQDEVQKLRTDLTIRHGFGNTNTTEAGALRLTVLTDRSVYKIGEQVSFGVIVENTGSYNVTYTSPTPCAPDVRVVVSDGSTTHDITTDNGSPCIQVLQGRTLQESTYVVQTGTWNMTPDRGGSVGGAVLPGTYTIFAVFPYASFEKTLTTSSVEITVVA